jgi:hypothetical protein
MADQQDPYAGLAVAADAATVESNPEQEQDLYAGIAEPASSSDGGDKFIQGAVGGALEGGPMVAGALSMAKAGAIVGAATGPFAPVAVPTLTTLGLLGGGYMGYRGGKELRRAASEIQSPFGEGTLTTMEGEGPEYVAGEVFGSSVSGGLGFLGLAKAGLKFGTSRVGQFVNKIFDTAKNTPGSFMFAETAGATGASGGAFAAETLAPNSPLARFLAEAAGGFLMPSRMMASPIMYMRQKLSDVGKVLPGKAGEAAAENKAAKILGDLLEQYGEDPVALRDALANSEISSVTGRTTVAAETGSKAMADLQQRLIELDPSLEPKVREIVEINIDNMTKIVSSLADSGDPALVTMAAEAKSKVFDSLLQNRIDRAQKEIMDLTLDMAADTPETRSQVSVRAMEIASKALSDARGVERGLWDQVAKDIPLSGQDSDVAGIIFDLKAQRLLRGDNLDPAIESFMTDVMKAESLIKKGKEVPKSLIFNSNDLLKVRTKSRELSMQAAAAGDYAKANIYNQINDAALDAVDSLFVGDPSYSNARKFSYALNETFTRTFAGKSMASDKTGANRLVPEAALKQALSSGNEASALKFEQLENATRFLDAQKIVDVEYNDELATQMMDAQETFLRLVLTESVDSSTGIPSVAKMKTTLRNQSELLSRFPELQQVLEKSIKSQDKLAFLMSSQKKISAAVKQSAFAKILDVDSPSQAIGKALNSSKPVTELSKLAKFAARSGSDVKAGMASSVITHVYNRARQPNGMINFNKFEEVMFGSISDKGETIADILKANGILDADSFASINQVIDAAKQLDASLSGAGASVQSLENANALVTLLARVGGSSIATGIPRALNIPGNNASIIQAQAGSQAGRKILERVPAARLQNILSDAIIDKELMAMLLAKPEAEADKIKAFKQLHAYLLASGYLAIEDESEQP